MTLEDLIEQLQRGIRSGRLDPELPVLVRDPEVSEEAMEAGSAGWTEEFELLIVAKQVHILPAGDYGGW